MISQRKKLTSLFRVCVLNHDIPKDVAISLALHTYYRNFIVCVNGSVQSAMWFSCWSDVPIVYLNNDNTVRYGSQTSPPDVDY